MGGLLSDRIVKIKLDADATGAVRGFAAVVDAAAETKARVHESARSQRAEWSTVGAGLTAVGVAVTGVGLAALKTGVQYNTLQQTTRAALSTLLGSAQAANAQMDKLDAFAKNSPFAKQTFISAQQQMLAFGIETQKVIPYLDSVQNAVAAMGGSNQQITEISFIMSQISAASKITGQDLMQFGQRGINAAELIGSQMGKTGAQIRSDITAGALDADKALEALSAGMDAKFGGAAANVKNTFEGAMDRVKAAWRDFASELARPLVDPNGGGALVDLLNWAADMMRAFEGLPEPVKATVSALTGVVGVSALLGGTFMLALPRFLAFKDALRDIGVTGGAVKGGLRGVVSFLGGPWGLAILAAATTLQAFNAQMENSKATAEELQIGMKQGADGFAVMRAESEKGMNVAWIYDLTSSLDNLGTVLEENANYANGFTKFLNQNFDAKAAIDNVRELGTVLASLASDDMPRAQKEFASFGDAANLTSDQLALALNEMPAFKSALLDYAAAAGVATDDSTLLKLALGEIEATGPQNALEALAGVAAETTDAIAKLADQIADFGSAQIDADRAAIALEDRISSLSKIVAEGGGSLGVMSDQGRKTESAMLDLVDAAGKSADAILKSSGSQEEATAVLERARQVLIDHRVALGDDVSAAAAWADARLASSESVTKALEGVTQAAEDIPPQKNANVKTDADSATGKLRATRGAQDAIKPDINTRVTADTSGALGPLQVVGQWLDRIASGAHATITTSGGSTGEGAAAGGNTKGKSGGRAYGGTIGFAQGGTIPGYANGDTVGIGGGVRNGTVWGLGTAKSDSINVNLSRGEEVIQEPYASLHRPLLKAINRGDFVAGSQAAQRVVIVREIGDVYVQNPVSGAYLLSKMADVANAQIDGFASEQAQANRTARY